MNTRIDYLYRDSGNFKKYLSVVLTGEIAPDALNDYFHEGSFFIPSEVGLTDLQPNPFTTYDHIWHEIEEVAFTNNPPTVLIQAANFLSDFIIASSNSWNEKEVYSRKGLL